MPFRHAIQKGNPYPVDQILPLLCEGETYKELDGDVVKTASLRLACLKRSQECVSCGIKGSIFVKEATPQDARPHLNLYAIKEDGDPVLMTRDHVIPVSKGGKNRMSNLVTMCCTCNERKGNKMPDEL